MGSERTPHPRIHAEFSPRYRTTHSRNYAGPSPRHHTMLLRSMTRLQQRRSGDTDTSTRERISSTETAETAIISAFPLNSILEPLPAMASSVDFGTSQKRLYDEQKNSIEFMNKHAELLSQQCRDYKRIIHLKNIIRKLDHSCLFCKELAWNPHICITNERRKGIESGKSCRCPACEFPVFRKPIPSITIQNVVERIATKLQIVCHEAAEAE
ncbi:hypothetical protein F5877DRAFT_71867 [Lentinula edodes]|nr:hypothetical protein F5877DRAFT_71867 [Lentinula edodes]